MPAREKKRNFTTTTTTNTFSQTHTHTTLIINRTLTDRTTDIIERGVRERKREFRKEIHASSLSLLSSSR
jgi:hypothetical protein